MKQADDKNKPLVSIITPSYNQGKFIEDTIRSVLSQDYTNVEYIVIDGGSTDNTVDILKKYEGKFKWISEKDKGQSDAINKGFKMAKGDILAWLNSDDTYLQGAISKVADFFQTHPDTGAVYGKTHFIDEAGKIVGQYPTEPFDFKRLAVFNFICQPSMFFKKIVWNEIGGLDMNLNYSMDYDLWIKIVRRFRVEYFNEFLSTYRLHTESKTISDIHALKNNEECLKTVMKLYNWAPANRVYGYYYYLVKNNIPSCFSKLKFIMFPIVFIVSLVAYLRINKGVNLKDLKMLRPSYIKKMINGWEFKNLLR